MRGLQQSCPVEQPVLASMLLGEGFPLAYGYSLAFWGVIARTISSVIVGSLAMQD